MPRPGPHRGSDAGFSMACENAPALIKTGAGAFILLFLCQVSHRLDGSSDFG
jgi:hypothetical protein